MTSQPVLSTWELEIAGRRLSLNAEIVLGRDPECDVALGDQLVSWRHAKIVPGPEGPLLIDLGSSNGTFLDGRRVGAQPTLVKVDAIVQLGAIRGRLKDASSTRNRAHARFRRIALRDTPVTIGRAPTNDVVLQEPNVSWCHAEVRPGRPPTIVDLGSRNGIRLGHELLNRAGKLIPEVEAGIGPFTLRVESGELVVSDHRQGLSMLAQQVSVTVGGKTILQPSSLRVAPGEFVALIGPSGSGKTTLLKCLAGVADPSRGQVLIGGEPLRLRQTEVGYVPQAHVVHDRLTVREALTYAARLRLPSDTRPDEHRAAVDDVMAELRLEEHAATQVRNLSGGQRKRVACGIELIGKPTMVLLDEPTSGLDPALERRLMQTLRRLADSGRGIVVVTHATSSLALCDTVAVMAPGGHLLFNGSPQESLDHFSVGAYDEIYDAIELTDIPPTISVAEGLVRKRVHSQLLSGRSLVKHTVALLTRYARTFSRDRRTLAIQLGQAPVMGLLIVLLYPSHLLARPDHAPGRSAQFLFLLVTVALWLGLIDSCREIVKERSIILRELAVGVRLDGYLIAKGALLFSLSAVQCALVLAVATAVQPLHAAPSTYLELLGLLIVTSWTTVGIGLIVSTLARSVDQATSLIPLLLIPQLLFGGVLVPLAKMQPPVKAIADLMASRWGFAGAGNLIGMNTRLGGVPRAQQGGFGVSFFSLNPGIAVSILGGLSAALLLITAWVLAARARRAAD